MLCILGVLMLDTLVSQPMVTEWEGQADWVGYDKVSNPVQVLPRKVPAISQPMLDVALSVNLPRILKLYMGLTAEGLRDDLSRRIARSHLLPSRCQFQDRVGHLSCVSTARDRKLK